MTLAIQVDNIDQFVSELTDMGYLEVCYIETSPGYYLICGLYRLLYTMAICYEIDDIGYMKRFCFEDATLARSELKDWHGRNFEGWPEGWVAKRGE